MKRNLNTLLISIIVAGLSWSAQAGNLASCYNSTQLPEASPVIPVEIFVMLDETTPLDITLRQSVANNLKTFLVPGNAFTIIRFSAYTQGKYMEVVASGRLNPLLTGPVRNSISKPVLARFDQCIASQRVNATTLSGKALRHIFEHSSSEIAKSDVISSLHDMSSRVRSSQASRKIVLIASDMLENSAVSSFYSNQAVRMIDPVKELRNVTQHKLIADFGNAEVHVIGAGLLAIDSRDRGTYRSPQTMQSLATFWNEYFLKSHAKLIQFGQPALLTPLQ